ncbi:MAG: polyphosphate kinase 1 [Planctomyces sp.]|nr:polyphosphate kinase 1 [Planctomyces sp.]
MARTAPPRYINRELSWLEFNQRVLDEAADATIPLLERLKFLAISASNLDEFFRVRVGGLQMLVNQGVVRPDSSGLTPEEQLAAIHERVQRMTQEQHRIYAELEPQLAAHGIRRLRSEELSKAQRSVLQRVFDEEVYPVLSPMAVTSADDFPLLSNGLLCVCVRIKPRQEGDADRYAIVPCGPGVTRFLSLPSEAAQAFILLEDALALLAGRFFPGEAVLECVPFRITRNADMELREDSASDLLEEMQQLLFERRVGDCARLELGEQASANLEGFLRSTLELSDTEIIRQPGPLELSDFFRLTDRPAADVLKYEAWPPQPSSSIPAGSAMFDVIAGGDLLLYHPYESFEPVVRFVEEAANDPDVLAIKQTLYRTARDSQIVAALLRAAERGKHVTVIVELKARFDEARNIEWARQLEQAGAQVLYGVKGLKTHAKVCLVVRREPQGIVRYMHFGTGNYNEITSRIYSDTSLLTCDRDLGMDAAAFFNAITGYSHAPRYRKIEAAPIGLRDKLLEMIRAEIEFKSQGQPARIDVKVNALVDPLLIDALYEASQAGVDVRLNVRGICCLRPGVKGLSENIEVVSVIDRFLEHARILHFHHGGDHRMFISSADWMTRNLDRRVELLVPVEDPVCRDRLMRILNAYFDDNVKSRKLLSDGRHRRLTSGKREPFRAQERLYEEARRADQLAQQQQRTTFEPHRRGA